VRVLAIVVWCVRVCLSVCLSACAYRAHGRLCILSKVCHSPLDRSTAGIVHCLEALRIAKPRAAHNAVQEARHRSER
jgi:hypothetical protein